MLDALHLSSSPAFGPAPGQRIGDFAPVTFLFGANGSGKTTLSRALTDPSRYPGSRLEWDPTTGPLSVKVYNRDYVERTINQAANLPGVFLLGETSAEAQAEIASLEGPTGTIEQTKNLRRGLLTKRDENVTNQQAARETLRKRAWEAKASVASELEPMFAGYNGSRDKLVGEVIRIANMRPATGKRLSELVADAATVFDDSVSSQTPLPLYASADVSALDGADLMPVAIVGRTDVRLAGLIERLHNADWVEHGRHLLQESHGVCPFCQQPAPTDLEALLAAYFDETYATQMAQVRALRDNVQAWATGLRQYVADTTAAPARSTHIQPDAWAAAVQRLEHVIDDALDAVEKKIGAPSTPLEFPSPTAAAAALLELVDAANTEISAHNARIRARSTLRSQLIVDCWTAFVTDDLAASVAEYSTAMTTLRKTEQGIAESLARTDTRVKEFEDRLSQLHSETTSSRPIIETINKLLLGAGFHNFTLGPSESLRDGYTIRRANGDVASESLSEGERTFISFLYFAQSLEGTRGDNESSNLLAVIDDPISSLDSDVLYAVSTIVRHILRRIADGLGRVRQLIVLTHNAHFHKEVIYEPPRKADKTKSGRARRIYGVVRKHPTNPSIVEFTDTSPIQTAYAALWDEVKRAETDQRTPVVGLQNVLRRIVETYFKVLGSIDTDEIVAHFNGSDRWICEALFSWVNAGSHTIFDDLHYTQTTMSLTANLDVFRRIFEHENQTGHYRMMMGLPLEDEPDSGTSDSDDDTSE
ncbi:AAA family ATPase [Curtobacterium poinsettiae]|uniref:AAA family ATPase n=1 Tax=Curtobacterium poinsettiae TaxID=159612 RepID=UPI00399EFEA3